MPSIKDLNLHLQSLIFATDKPISITDLYEIISTIEPFTKFTKEDLQQQLNLILEQYQSSLYPFQVILSGGGYQFVTKKEYFKTITKINEQKFKRRLSNAALETLSIIAYKQPVTKLDIEQIRGVSADYALQRLLERNLILIAGRKEDAIGKPLLYETTTLFLDYLGINHIHELPKIHEFQEEGIAPTNAPKEVL